MSNIFEAITEALAQELFEDIVSNDKVRIERIVSSGQSSPAQGWYDQPQAEWVMVVRGKAVIAYPDKPAVTLDEGDYVTIAAHEKHRVEWTAPDEDTIWLAVHY